MTQGKDDIKVVLYLLQKFRPYKTSCDCREAVDRYDKAPAAFYSFDYAFGSFEETAGDADFVAFKKIRRDFAQGNQFVGDGSDKDEIVHLPFRNRFRTFAIRIQVEIYSAVKV